MIFSHTISDHALIRGSMVGYLTHSSENLAFLPELFSSHVFFLVKEPDIEQLSKEHAHGALGGPLGVVDEDGNDWFLQQICKIHLKKKQENEDKW